MDHCMDCAITSNKLWFGLTMLPFTHSFQRQMSFGSITFKMQFSYHQRFNWNLWYLNTFNDTHERARHVTQHIELFANKFNLMFMEPWGGHSLHILASTSNDFYFFHMLRNNEKNKMILILNYRHPICIICFFKNSKKLNPIFFWVLSEMKWK